MDILSLFAERLKELIFDNNSSPEIISRDLNHNLYDIYHWMSKGNKYMPSVANIVKFADYFNCSIEFFVGIADEFTSTQFNVVLPKFSERFLFVVKSNGYNFYKLGRVTATSTTTYYRWKNGLAIPTIDSLIKVSKALDCSIDYLIGREL